MQLAKNERPRIAILVSTIDFWGQQILQGILTYAKEVGPWNIHIKPGNYQDVDNMPPEWDGHGIIATVKTQNLASQLKQRGLPVINVFDTDIENFSAPCFRTDDEAGAQIAIDHFRKMNLRNFAFVGPTTLPNARKYQETYEKELAKSGDTCETFKLVNDNQESFDELTEWLQRLPKPTGIFVWGNGYARFVVDCCMEAEISVPHDIAVLSGGFDELLSQACFPALSGLISPTKQIGYQAAKALHQAMLGKTVPNETNYIAPLGVKEQMSTNTMAIDDENLIKVITYLKEHACEPITMADILKVVPLSQRSLERRFQDAFGYSPVEEIRRIRIDKARMLLSETNLQMQEIAECCGYATYNYLSQIFKQSTGMTAREYRKQFRH